MKHINKKAVSAAVTAAAVCFLMGIRGAAAIEGNSEYSPGEVLVLTGEELAQAVSEMGAEVAEDASDPYRDRPDLRNWTTWRGSSSTHASSDLWKRWWRLPERRG